MHVHQPEPVRPMEARRRHIAFSRVEEAEEAVHDMRMSMEGRSEFEMHRAEHQHGEAWWTSAIAEGEPDVSSLRESIQDEQSTSAGVASSSFCFERQCAEHQRGEAWWTAAIAEGEPDVSSLRMSIQDEQRTSAGEASSSMVFARQRAEQQRGECWWTDPAITPPLRTASLLHGSIRDDQPSPSEAASSPPKSWRSTPGAPARCHTPLNDSSSDEHSTDSVVVSPPTGFWGVPYDPAHELSDDQFQKYQWSTTTLSNLFENEQTTLSVVASLAMLSGDTPYQDLPTHHRVNGWLRPLFWSYEFLQYPKWVRGRGGKKGQGKEGQGKQDQGKKKGHWHSTKKVYRWMWVPIHVSSFGHDEEESVPQTSGPCDEPSCAGTGECFCWDCTLPYKHQDRCGA